MLKKYSPQLRDWTTEACESYKLKGKQFQLYQLFPMFKRATFMSF